jgi:uncharacterized protein YdeI (YjbR/CyaY-like superfamily)
MKHLYVPDRKTWRAWLERNAAVSTEVWLVYYKKGKSGARKSKDRKPSVPYEDAVEEALCFGWIDSTVRTLDESRYVQRFTPRKSGSQWSASNIARVKRLQESGRMMPAGMAAFAGHAARRATPHPTVLPPELECLFEAQLDAWTRFNALPPGYRRTAIGWVASAKKDETRRRRLSQLIAAAARGERIKFV